MKDFRIDALERIDSNLNMFFAEQLKQVRQALFQKQYPAFKGRIFVPVKNDINLGAQTVAYRTIDEAGEAAPVTDKADDVPTVEITGGTEDSNKMKGIRLAYGWDLDEARAALFTGQDLQTTKAMMCRRGIERFIDRTLLIGSTAWAGTTMYGLFTLAGGSAPLTYTPNVTTLEDESPDDIALCISGIVDKLITNSNEIETPDTLGLPVTTNRLISNRRMGDGSNVTIKQFVLSTTEEIKTILTSPYLEANGGHGGGAVKRMVAYARDAEKLEGLVNEFEQLPPEFKSSKVMTECRARVGGLATYRPKSIAYGDNI